MALSLPNLVEPGHAAPAMPSAAPHADRGEALRLRDGHGRALTDLRLSVTDRCNYRCVYCRTGNEGAQFTELPIAIYARMLRVFVSLGIEKVRLTGGEPLLREGLLDLIRETARDAACVLGGSAGHCDDHQRPSARAHGEKSEGGRADADHGQHGCGGPRDVYADHAGSGEL